MDKAWKQLERRVARYFGGERTPLSGRSSRHTSGDVIHPTLYVEIKQRAVHTAVTLWRATSKQAKREDRTPVVVLSEKGKAGFWVLVHSDHLGDAAAARFAAEIVDDDDDEPIGGYRDEEDPPEIPE